jgi:nicotinamidase-related amidase
MKVTTGHSIGLLIDVQERLFTHMSEPEQLKKKLLTFVKGLKVLSVPFLFTQQYTRGLGETLPELLEEFSPIPSIEKMTFSCCKEPAFLMELEKHRPRFVLIGGIESHVCVLQTCLDLLDGNYIPVIVSDCISSRNPVDKMIAIERMRQEGAIITSLESILFELTVISGTEQFKAISKLIK